MEDRELLGLAAQSVGYYGKYSNAWRALMLTDYPDSFGRPRLWNPLQSDSQAFQLLHEIFRRLSDDQLREVNDFFMSGTPEGLRRTIVEIASKISESP